MEIKKIMITFACLQITLMSQAMMTGMRKLSMNGMANASMRAFGGVGSSMVGRLSEQDQGNNSFVQDELSEPSMLKNQEDLSKIFDAENNPTIANVNPIILPKKVINNDNVGNNVVNSKINVIDQVNQILASDALLEENNNILDTPLQEFDTQEFNDNVARQGVSVAIFAPSRSNNASLKQGNSTQKREFSSSARTQFIPFKPKSNNPYDVLGVAQGANLEQIKAAYKTLARQYHPDNNLNNKEQATQAMKLINNAFDKLRSGRVYDVQDTTMNDVWSNADSGQSSKSSESKPKYDWNDYIDYSDGGQHYKNQYNRWKQDPNSSYNKPRNIVDAFLQNGSKRHLALIKELLKTASNQEINAALFDFISLYGDTNIHSRQWSSSVTSRLPMTSEEEELAKLMLNKLSTVDNRLVYRLFGLDANKCTSKKDLIDALILKGINFNVYTDDNQLPFLLDFISIKPSLDIIQKLIVDGHVDLTMKIENQKNVGNATIDKLEFLIDFVKNNKDFTSDQRAERIDYYNSVIQLLKQYGAKKSSY